jgi:hypothetical protein
MAQFSSYDELIDWLGENDGVITCQMGSLRDAHGAGKLGINVVANIKEELEGRGLGHIPSELPQNQYAAVRVYKKSSPVGKIIDAVGTIDDRSDKFLRSMSKNESEKILKKIRELVCE